MPWRDKTGPSGRGPLTGRGWGLCAEDRPQIEDRPPERGFGRGFGGFGKSFGRDVGRGVGRGFGFGRGFGYEPRERELPRSDEKDALKSLIRSLEEQLKDAKNELRKL